MRDNQKRYNYNCLFSFHDDGLEMALLRIDLPCRMLRASTLLCWAHILSSWRTLFLLRAATAAPGTIIRYF